MQGGAEAANYPFCTIDPNIGVVPVPDFRLQVLEELYQAKSVVPAIVEMVDIAGLVKGASKGEGMGNQFLSHIREVDAIVHMVRCFEDEQVVHVHENVDPLRDIEIINIELAISDLEIVERRLAKVIKANKNTYLYAREPEVLQTLQKSLTEGQAARLINWDNPDDLAYAETLNLLTGKPVLYACNVKEEEVNTKNAFVQKVEDFAKAENSEAFIICAKIEEEISSLDAEEKEMFLEELGLSQGGLDRLIAAGYKLLGLISFLTAGPKEVRAWTIRKGQKAPQAAGKIHSDMERGFIRAEVVDFEALERLGSYNKAKESGLIRVEGKEYVVKDGDVMLIRFNV